MELDELPSVLLDRVVDMEAAAQHRHALACVAEATACLARRDADVAQHVLSEIKVWLALLPDGAKLELRAAKPDAVDPAARLGVRARLPVPRLAREEVRLASQLSPQCRDAVRCERGA